MELILYTVVSVMVLFFAMLALLEVGRRIGLRQMALNHKGVGSGLTTLSAAVFGLLGLIVSFSFSGGARRFDERRELIIEEANDIGTAYLRIDLLPADAQPVLRDLFRSYLDSRLAAYRKLPDIPAAEAELAHSRQLQGEIWKQAVAACEKKNEPATTSLVLSAINPMFDITSTRTYTAQMHPHIVVFVMLIVLALTSSLLAGHGIADKKIRSRIHIYGFAIVVAATIYVIIDMEYPRFGFIRVNKFDTVLEQLQQSIK